MSLRRSGRPSQIGRTSSRNTLQRDRFLTYVNRPHGEGGRGCPGGGRTKKGLTGKQRRHGPPETDSESESDAEVEL